MQCARIAETCFLAAGFLLACLALPPAPGGAQTREGAFPARRILGANVGVIDSASGKSTRYALMLEESLRHQSLSLLLRTCRHDPEYGEMAFLEARFHISESLSEPVFSGWIFAEDPALSAMEHPLYNVWLSGCIREKRFTPAPLLGETDGRGTSEREGRP